MKKHQPEFQGQQGLQGHFQGKCRDNRDTSAQRCRGGCRQPGWRRGQRTTGGEEVLRARATNSSSGDVWHVRRGPGPAGSGATRTRPTRPSHCEAGEREGVPADGAPPGRSGGWGRPSPAVTPLAQQQVGLLVLWRLCVAQRHHLSRPKASADEAQRFVARRAGPAADDGKFLDRP